MGRRTVVTALIVVFCISLVVEVKAQTLPSGQRLQEYVTSTQVGIRTDQEGLFGSMSGPYTTVFDREFNSGTVTCYPAWEAWTGVKQYNLTNINNRINYLENAGKTQMMHLLVGPDFYFPDWFKNGTFSNAELDDMLHHWIKTIIQSNGNDTKVEVWNVVNEAISFSPPWEYNVAIKFHQLGFETDASGLTGSDKVVDSHPIYIRKAFEYARQFTDAKLELRDSGAEFSTSYNSYKYKLFYQLTKHLLNTGTPLDAVGFQLHFDIDRTYDWVDFKSNIHRYRALGLETYITELDIGDTGESWNSAKAQQQRRQYYEAVKAGMETDCEYIHIWGMIDGRDAGWRTNESPLLFDANYDPKPAYYGVQDALYASQGDGGNAVVVRARGTTGTEQMQVLVNDMPIQTWTLSTSMQDYTASTSLSSGNLKVSFINDTGSPDVQVDYVKTNGLTYQAEDQATNTGTWQGQCGGAYSEWLHCSGHIDFGATTFGPIQGPEPPSDLTVLRD